MSEERQFRFLIPPFFFGLSLLVGAWFSGIDIAAIINESTAEKLLVIVAAIGAAALPIGFFLTSVSILVLRLITVCSRSGTYEVVVPKDWLSRIWPFLRLSRDVEPKWLLYAAATFDHELIPAETHSWIQRRWGAFHTSAHSCVAIMLSHFGALSPPIHETWQWITLSLVSSLVLGCSALLAWRHVMHMLEFQSYRKAAVSHAHERSD